MQTEPCEIPLGWGLKMAFFLLLQLYFLFLFFPFIFSAAHPRETLARSLRQVLGLLLLGPEIPERREFCLFSPRKKKALKLRALLKSSESPKVADCAS